MEEKHAHHIVIPENVLYCKKIPANAKLLYGEIISLCNDKGYCWASNGYLAELFSVSITSISLWIASLQKNGFIECEIGENNARKIFLNRGTRKLKEGSLRKVKHIHKQSQLLSAGSAVEDDDFVIETKEWIDKNGVKHRRDTIDYG